MDHETRTMVFHESSIREFERLLESARFIRERLMRASDEELGNLFEARDEIAQEIVEMAIRKFLP